MQGTDEYIGVGNNIMFDAGLVNPTSNMNSDQSGVNSTTYILAHVESVEHSFANIDGARTYTTTVQFVRGILVSGSPGNVRIVGEGALDEDASDLKGSYKNTANTMATSTQEDPDPKKQRGT